MHRQLGSLKLSKNNQAHLSQCNALKTKSVSLLKLSLSMPFTFPRNKEISQEGIKTFSNTLTYIFFEAQLTFNTM